MAISTYFNAAYYLQQNPDVMAAGNTADFAWAHYMNHGAAEALTGANPARKPAPWFDIKFYVDSYPDLVAAGLSPVQMFEHFTTYGISEGRSPANGIVLTAANLGTYAAENPDLQTAFGITDPANLTAQQQLDLANHFYTYGYKEDRPGEPANVDVIPGETFTLTTGIDNLVGTPGNDIFNAVETATSAVLGGLDKIDGGAGTDTFNIADTTATATFALPTGFSGKSIENLNITTNNNIGATGAGNSFVVSGTGAMVEGVTSFTGVAAGAVGSFISAAGTTDVNLTVSGNATATVVGGKAVSVTAGAASTGAVSVTGKELTSVTVKGGGALTIDNLENTVAATSAKGTTLTSVTLDSVDAASAIKGEGLADVTVKGATTAARTVTITNAKANHELTVNVDGTGYKSDGTAAQTVVVDAAAKAITVNATGAKSSLSLAGSTATKTVNITGSADLTLLALASATKIDGASSTGSLTLGDLAVGTVNVSTGSGNDSFALQATTKVTVDAGSGNDSVTLKSGVVAGSTISLGAGDDKLLFGTGGSVAASTSTATTVIDAGDGADSVSAALINAANAAQFKNFEGLDLSAAVANLDVDLMTGSTIGALTLSGRGAAAVAQVSNVAAGVGLTVTGDNDAVGSSTTINVKGASTGTTDSFAVTFAGAAVTGAAATAPNVTAGDVVVNKVETVTLESAGAANTWNSIDLADDALKTLTITGEKNLDLTFGTIGEAGGAADNTKGVALIDGSAATGKLNIDLLGATVNIAFAGLSVKGGSANDTIDLVTNAGTGAGIKASVDAGAGDDTIIASDAGGTFTGGAGNDKFDISLADANSTTVATAVITNITDFVAGDVITLNATTPSFVAAKVALDNTVQDLDDALALALGNTTAGQINWFQYGTDTYVVQNVDATTGLQGTDIVVKLTGLIDLSTGTLTGADLSIA